MKVFHCERCNHLLFFENSRCIVCDSRLAYIAEAGAIASLPPDAGEVWEATVPQVAGQQFRLCQNYVEFDTCNWAVSEADGNLLCRSCRLTKIIPDTSTPENRTAWYRVEAAKRRLVFTLIALGLPIFESDGRHGSPRALTFEFKADPIDPAAPRVLTGHADGVITINIAEADDAERERRRQGLGEPYRTLLGHMRHESGHYYWDRLISDSAELEGFRKLFGDEQRDYSAALKVHYDQGPPADWPSQFVSAYAASHPWEDWAETWAHYLHMVDTLETGADNGIVLTPPRPGEPALPRISPAVTSGRVPFDRLIESWFSLTYVLNNLNRGLGLADGYPFVLSTPAIDKLRFVHDVICRATTPVKE